MKSATVQVRVTLSEMEYLTGVAEDMGISLSEAVRVAIARSQRLSDDHDYDTQHPDAPVDLP